MSLTHAAAAVDGDRLRRLLLDAGIVDDGYPLASLVWRPRGVQLMQCFAQRARSMLTGLGYEEHVLPSIAAWNEFHRINANIHDFSKGVLRPTPNIVLRPSGESVFYPMFRRWIRTEADLPLRAFEIGRSIRAGRPQGLFRQTESALFVEAHSAHATQADAHAQCAANLDALASFLASCGVPGVHVVRPGHTNKPVALVHHGFDVMLPSGQGLLVASAYEQGQVFSRAFDVRFRDRHGQVQHTWQTELGFSHRILLASLWLTSDAIGLCMLPWLASPAVVVLQVGSDPRASQAAQWLLDALTGAGIGVQRRQVSLDGLGKARSRIELEGTPVRIDVGLREADAGQVTVRGRDGVDLPCTLADAVSRVPEVLARIEQHLLDRARARCEALSAGGVAIHDVAAMLRAGKAAGTVLCPNAACVDSLENLVGVGEVLGHRHVHAQAQPCGVCAAQTELEAVVARRI